MPMFGNLAKKALTLKNSLGAGASIAGGMRSMMAQDPGNSMASQLLKLRNKKKRRIAPVAPPSVY
jgi:hypothetical protein